MMNKAVLSGSFRHGSPPSGEASWPDGAVLRYRGKESFSAIAGRQKDSFLLPCHLSVKVNPKLKKETQCQRGFPFFPESMIISVPLGKRESLSAIYLYFRFSPHLRASLLPKKGDYLVMIDFFSIIWYYNSICFSGDVNRHPVQLLYAALQTM